MEQEGFYIRMCAFVFETGRRLPLNDSIAAKIMGVHTNAYRKVLKQLIEIGKVKKYADGYAVDRAEKEHVAAAGGRAVPVSERQADGQTDQDTGWETRPDTLVDPPHNTPIDTPQDTRGVCAEKANEINTPFREPEPVANNHKKDTKLASVESGTPRDVLAGPIDPMIADLIGWMSFGDERTARQWLSNTIRACGQEPTNDAYAKLKTELATGSLIAHPIQTWSKIAQRMRDEAKRKAASSAGYGYVDHKVSSNVVRYAKPDMSDNGMVRKAVSHA